MSGERITLRDMDDVLFDIVEGTRMRDGNVAARTWHLIRERDAEVIAATRRVIAAMAANEDEAREAVRRWESARKETVA